MGHPICHHKGRYNIYSTISDSFWFKRGLTLAELTDAIKEEYGQQGLRDLPDRLERAHKCGHSAYDEGDNLANYLNCNRAGKDEACLSFEECIKQFFGTEESKKKE